MIPKFSRVFFCLGILTFIATNSAKDCWTTGCQPNSWTVKGCAQYNRIEIKRFDCKDGKGNQGHNYTCCASNSGPCSAATSEINAVNISFTEFTNALTLNRYPAPSCSQYESFIAGLPSGLITDKQEAAMFLANIFQESDGLRAKREYACVVSGCPGSYATPGCDIPGQHYFGRGYIQLTWCYNYRPASLDLYNDERLVQDPDLVARDEKIAWETAFWFWKENVHNKSGVKEGRFGATTRAINGALECDGLSQAQAQRRFAMYSIVRGALGLEGRGDERGCYN